MISSPASCPSAASPASSASPASAAVPDRTAARVRGGARPPCRLLTALAGLLALVLAASPARPAQASGATESAAPGWILDDMDRALSAARSSDRYLLINFTGSNWCGWCIRLDREVFGHPHFRQEAGRDLVLVALDFPRPSNQSEEVRRRNAEWRDRLGVRGFPTVYLADAEGRPFARTGYRPGGVVRYLEHLRELIGLRRGQEQLVARAMRTEGLDRARLLGQALAVPGIMTPEQDEILDLIREADPEDSLGLIARFGGDEGEDEEDAAGDDAEGGEEAEAPKTPLQRDLEAVRAMIESGELDGVARALRDVQRTYRPEGAELADWALVRIDFLVALERPGPAVRQASRTMRVRGMPGEAAQRLGHRKALILLGMGRGEAALKAWDEAIGLAESELATEMREGRAEFAARCREAS